MKRQQIGHFLRIIGLYKPFDFLRYVIFKIIKLRKNKLFLKENPTVVLPPDYLMYESFQLDYKKYYNDSIDSAKEIINKISLYKKFENINILDWGCGPARIIRHLPNFLSDTKCSFYATDYNKKTIQWCKDNINDVYFNHNNLSAKLPYSDNFFEVVYGISIFTHLSEKMHYEWYNELIRITKEGGIIYLTMHGNAFREKLVEHERKIFDSGKIVVRDKVKEGHRTFASFHPEAFVKNLFNHIEILEHIKGNTTPKPQQDIWILRKK